MRPVVLFDLDGTLIDSIDLIVASFAHTRKAHFGDEFPRSHWVSTIGVMLRDQFIEWADGDEARAATFMETYREHNFAHHDQMVKPYAGIPEALTALRESDVRMGIVTSKARKGALRGLPFVGGTEQFEVIITSDDVENGKPHPEPVERALRAMGAAASDAVFVGDSTHDIHCGNAAGVATRAVAWGPFERASLEAAKPGGFLEHPSELAAWASMV